MGYSAKILLDSVSPGGARLTTFEVTFPRIVLAEYNTHRVFSRNSASSRAIPVQKMLARVLDDPFLPVYWGKNQKGMQAEQELSVTEIERATSVWLSARDSMVDHVNQLLDIGVHKQIANRLLEPFMYHTVICTATEWSNFFNLRAHKDAQPEIQKIAAMMKEMYVESEPKLNSTWHLPLVTGNDFDDLVDAWHEGTFGAGLTLWEAVKRVSAGRCARVSCLTHDGKRDPQADIDLCNRLASSGHMSPLEHVARPATDADVRGGEGGIDFGESDGQAPNTFFANFRGWVQMRREVPNESDPLGKGAAHA